MIVLLMDFMIVRCPYNLSYLDTPCPVALVMEFSIVDDMVVVVVVARISQKDHEQLSSNCNSY